MMELILLGLVVIMAFTQSPQSFYEERKTWYISNGQKKGEPHDKGNT